MYSRQARPLPDYGRVAHELSSIRGEDKIRVVFLPPLNPLFGRIKGLVGDQFQPIQGEALVRKRFRAVVSIADNFFPLAPLLAACVFRVLQPNHKIPQSRIGQSRLELEVPDRLISKHRVIPLYLERADPSLGFNTSHAPWVRARNLGEEFSPLLPGREILVEPA